MAVWEWVEEFIDRRVCSVEADTEDEARAKMRDGDWLSETTVDFYSNELIEDLKLAEEAPNDST
tara:strand:+ start:24 stop:215 length:192 start_codon:yes stop_codon:yes gene_type:complete